MSECRFCGAPILWAMTPAGKRMPIDAEPAPDGNLVLVNGAVFTAYTLDAVEGRAKVKKG